MCIRDRHYSIQMAAAQDYEGFYKEEMDYRELMGYPPVEQLLAVLMTGPDEGMLETAARYLKEFAKLADCLLYKSEDHIGPNEHKDFEDYKRCKGILFTQCNL